MKEINIHVSGTIPDHIRDTECLRCHQTTYNMHVIEYGSPWHREAGRLCESCYLMLLNWISNA